MGPYESENFKTLLLLQITAKSFQTCPEFSSQWSSQNYVGIFETLSFRIFNDFCFLKISNSPMEKSKTSIIWTTSDRRAKRSEIWESWVVFQHMWGTFGPVAFKVILRSFGAHSIFRNLRLMIRDGRKYLEWL